MKMVNKFLRVFFLVACFISLAKLSIAEIVEATIGGRNSSNQYRAKVTRDTSSTTGIFTFAPDTAIVWPYEHYTTANTNNQLTAAESGKTITDTGGASGPTAVGAGSKHILPRASVGLEFTLTVGALASSTLDTIDTSDTILYSITSTGLDAGDSIKSTGQAGDSVTVKCTSANTWSITAMKGTWTDNSTN